MGEKEKAKIWKQFCENTTLHGWAYIPATDKWWARVFWLGLIISGFSCAFIIISDSIVSWDNQPTLTTIHNYTESVTAVQFPTITICPTGWENDRWGFVRALLDEIKYPCNKEEDDNCKKFMEAYEFLLSPLNNYIYDVMEKLAQTKFEERDTNLIIKGYIWSTLWEVRSFDSYEDFDRNKAAILSGDLAEFTKYYNSYYAPGKWTSYDYEQHNLTELCIRNTSCEPTPLLKSARKDFWNFVITDFYTQEPLYRMIYGMGTMLASFFPLLVEDDWSFKDFHKFNPTGKSGSYLAISDSWLQTLPYDSFNDSNGYIYLAKNDSYKKNEYVDRIAEGYTIFGKSITEALYSTIQRLQDKFTHDATLGVSVLDIPAMMVETPDYFNRRHWSELFHYSSGILLNHTLASMEEPLKMFPNNTIGKKLTPIKEFVTKVMLLSAPLTAVKDPEESLFHKLFGETKTKFNERSPIGNLSSAVNNGLLDADYDVKRMLVLQAKGSAISLNTKTLSTDNGVCTVANVKPMGVYKNMAIEDINLFNWLEELNQISNYTLQHPTGSGISNAVTLFIMGPRNVGYNPQHGQFQVSFNENMDFFANLLSGVVLRPGIETMVTIHPTHHVVTDDFRALDFEQRKCKFSHETDEKSTSFFNNYTQKACQYTCSLRYLQKLMGCTPWDVPPLTIEDQDLIPLCDGVEAYKYKKEQEKYVAAKDPNCQCEPDCEYVSYSTETSNFPMTKERYCESSEGENESILSSMMFAREKTIPGMDHYKQIDSFTNGAWLKVEKFQEAIDQRWFDMYKDRDTINNCKERLTKEYAILRIIIKEPTLLKIVQSVRVSFSDKLGIAGGTIGLFTGLSLISVVETIYWLFRWLLQRTVSLAGHRREVKKGNTLGQVQKLQSKEAWQF